MIVVARRCNCARILPHAQLGATSFASANTRRNIGWQSARGEKSMIDNPKIDVAAVINNSAISRFQYTIFTVCFLIIVCDGFDTQAIAYVAPSIVAEWKLTPASFGPVFAAVILGAMIDRHVWPSRRPIRPHSNSGSVCHLVRDTQYCVGLRHLDRAFYYPSLSLRHRAGRRDTERNGSGRGVRASAKTLNGDCLDMVRLRAWRVLGGMISVPLIANFGWASVFVAGGILPFCLIPFVAFALPESIKFLIVAHDKTARVAAILRRIDPRQVFADTSVFVLDEPQPGRGQVSALFKDGLAAGSILLCLAFFLV